MANEKVFNEQQSPTQTVEANTSRSITPPKEQYRRPTLKIPPTQKDARKLFVGGLPADITNDEFIDFFTKFGETIDCCVMFDRDTGRSRGFGFITYTDPEVARNLLMMGNNNAPANTPDEALVGKMEMRDKIIEIKSAQPKESSARRKLHAYTHPAYNEYRGMVPVYPAMAPGYAPAPSPYAAAPLAYAPQMASPAPYVPGFFPYYYPHTMELQTASMGQSSPSHGSYQVPSA